MSQPLVSVLVPSYNQRRFLPDCLAGLDAQTFRDFDVTFCDDGSTDGTLEFLSAQGRLAVHHRKNRGTAEAINSAAALARGSLLTWVSSDNVMAPHWLETLVAAMDDDVGAVYSAYERRDQSRLTTVPCIQGPGPYDPARLIAGESCYFGPSFLIRREVWQPHRGRTAHDYDNWLRVEEACWAKWLGIRYVDRDLCVYRVGDWCTGRTRAKEYDAPKWRQEAIERRAIAESPAVAT